MLRYISSLSLIRTLSHFVNSLLRLEIYSPRVAATSSRATGLFIEADPPTPEPRKLHRLNYRNESANDSGDERI